MPWGALVADPIRIEITLDDGTVIKSFKRVENQGKKSARVLSKDFEKFEDGVRKRFSGLGSDLRRNFLALGASIVAAFAAREVLNATLEQEAAINQLNTALRNAGDFSEEASRDFQDFASSLQQVTAVGDEVILNQLALARTFARTNEEAKALVEAAIDLSAATGLSLEGSIKNLGRTFSGLTGELGESVAEVRNLTRAQLVAGDAIEIVGRKFQGFAASQAQTTSGQLQLLSANFGDLLESIGGNIIASPRFSEALENISGAIKGINDAIADTSGEPAFIRNIREQRAAAEIQLLNLESSIADIQDRISNAESPFQATQLEQGLQAAAGEAQFLRAEVQRLDAVLVQSLSNLEQSQAGFSPQEQAQAIQFQQLLAQATKQRIEAQLAGLQNLTSAEDFRAQRESLTQEKIASIEAEALVRREQLLQQFNDRRIVSQQELDSLLIELERTKNAQIEQLTQNAALNAEVTLDNLTASINQAFLKIDTSAAAIAQSITGSFVTGFTQAFSAIGGALSRGENAFEAFGNTVFSTLGSIAIQLGQFFILVGAGLTATQSILGLKGGQAIAAGVALQIFGGFIQGIGSGGGGEVGGGAAGGGTAVGGGFQETELPEVEPDDLGEEQRVVVNIQGDVLDSDETGTRIAQILQDSFEAEGVQVVRTA